MVTWGVTDAGVSSLGRDHDLVVRAADWTGEHADSLPGLTTDGDVLIDNRDAVWRRAGYPITGSTTRLTIPASTARIHGDDSTRLADQSTSLSAGTHRLTCVVEDVSPPRPRATDRESVTLTVHFQGPATLDRQEGAIQLSFDRKTLVTMRLVSDDTLTATVTIPDTPTGVAAGINAMTAVHETSGPDRSHPANRPHPPLLEVGQRLDVPSSIEPSSIQGRIELEVPDSFDSLFVAAPLAYYLGATVRTDDRSRPRLTVSGTTFEHQFSSLPGFQYECASLLRQVFYLDCLARDGAAAHGQLISELGLDVETLRTAGMAERLTHYEPAFGEELLRRVPEWHLSTYASPETEHLPAIPYLLDDLSLVYLPSAREIDSAELLDRTLSDSYRSAGNSVASVDVVKPHLAAGEVHAWLADGAPIDAFKTTPRAYEHRARYQQRPAERFDVTVVLNDESMVDEHTAVADIYRERAAELPIDLTVKEKLRADELATVLSTQTDFLHYIGHCDRDGLRCTDGTLSVGEIDQSRTRTFFLNACGSYHEGLNLVEKGSLAGAVTLRAVLNEQAAKVGTAFARLLVHGFSIERAIQLARRRILMGKDYAVVGDGTDSLVPARGQSALLRLSDHPDGYTVAYEPISNGTSGHRYRCPSYTTPGRADRTTETVVDSNRLTSVLERTSIPVIYNGDFHWSRDLAPSI